jgi:hypothetical protein
MTHTEATNGAVRELDFRVNDGLEVALLWRSADDRLTLEVVATKVGDRFRFEVEATEALEAFHHPFAYAAARGIDYVEPRRFQAEPASE